MYELTCPSCNNVMKLPFARVGANATCRACQERFAVDDKLLNHKTASAIKSGENPLVVDEEEPAAGIPDSLGAPPASELDEMEQALSETTPPLPRTRSRRRRKKRGVMVWVMVLVAILLAAGVGGLLAVVVSRGNQPSGNTSNPTGSNATSTNNQGSTSSASNGSSSGNTSTGSQANGEDLAPELPQADATRLKPKSWRQLSPRPPRSSRISHGPLRMENPQWVEKDGSFRYRAKMVFTGFDAFRSVSMTLSLVGYDGRVIARCDVPLGMMASGAERPIDVKVPREMKKETELVLWSASPRDPMPRAVLLTSLSAKPEGAGDRTKIRVEGVNPAGQTLPSTIVILTGFDAQDQLVGRWRVDWSRPIEPGGELLFETPTPVFGTGPMTRVDVMAAGDVDGG